MIIESMLMEKNVWDLIKKRPRPAWENPTLWQKEIKEDQMAIEIVRCIIIEGVNNQIAFNIMDL